MKGCKLEALIEAAEDLYDVDVIVDLLDLSVREILEAFPERFEEKLEDFERLYDVRDLEDPNEE